MKNVKIHHPVTQVNITKSIQLDKCLQTRKEETSFTLVKNFLTKLAEVPSLRSSVRPVIAAVSKFGKAENVFPKISLILCIKVLLPKKYFNCVM